MFTTTMALTSLLLAHTCLSGVVKLTEITFEQVQDGLKAGTFYLIDVRRSQELVNQGKIPGSVNIPISDLETSFIKIDGAEFQKQYGFDRSAPGKPVVIYCQGGGGAKAAIEKLTAMGINLDFRWYKGSFNEWVTKGGQIEK